MDERNSVLIKYFVKTTNFLIQLGEHKWENILVETLFLFNKYFKLSPLTQIQKINMKLFILHISMVKQYHNFVELFSS